MLDAQGKPLSVREALALINQTLDEALAEQEGDFDADSRWALAWFEHTGFTEGEYGVAETLSKAKNTSVAGLAEAGIVKSSRGKVRLLRPDELPADWDPSTDPRLTAWETVHQLIRALEKGGESAAAALVAKLGGKAEAARELCYRLYTICERKKRAAEALSYNALVQSWPEITRLARRVESRVPNKLRCLKGKRNNLWPLPTKTASARRRSSHGMLVRWASPTDPVQKRPEITRLAREGRKPRVGQGHVVRRNRGISHAD